MNTTPYHYTECGLDDVWIEGIEPHVDMAGKTVYRIQNLPGLHREIARSIVCDGIGMTGAELRFLRTELGLTQQEMGNILHVEALTISRWERGENPIHQNAMTVIRALAAERLKLDEIGIERISRQSVSDARTARVIIEGADPENYRAQRRVA